MLGVLGHIFLIVDSETISFLSGVKFWSELEFSHLNFIPIWMWAQPVWEFGDCKFSLLPLGASQDVSRLFHITNSLKIHNTYHFSTVIYESISVIMHFPLESLLYYFKKILSQYRIAIHCFDELISEKREIIYYNIEACKSY